MIAWLNNAYATEKNLVQVLQNHARNADLQPNLQIKLQEHLNETRRHADLVKCCIERLGGRTSTIKNSAGTFMGVMQGLATEFSGDEIVKSGWRSAHPMEQPPSEAPGGSIGAVVLAGREPLILR